MLNHKLNFLFITSDAFPPFRVDIKILFGKDFSRKGHTMDWLLQSEEPCRKSFQSSWAGGHAWVARRSRERNFIEKIVSHVSNILNDFRMFSLPRKNKYDFIQVKDKFFSAFLAIIACRIYKIKFFFWLSYPFPEAWVHEGITRKCRYPHIRIARGIISKFFLYRLIMPMADHVFVQSQQMLEDIVRESICKEKMTVVPMGIDDEIVPQPGAHFNGNKETEKIVVFLGIFFRVRKLVFLINMFKKVVEQIPDAKFLFVGKGEDIEEEERLKEKTRKLGLENNIIFTGYVPLSEALGYVEKATLCVSYYYPTFVLNSTSPTKVIEYMAAGKAVVGNIHPEQRLLIEKSGGGICVNAEEEDFAKAVVTLLNNQTLAVELGQKGRKYILKYRTYSTIASNLEHKYLELLSC